MKQDLEDLADKIRTVEAGYEPEFKVGGINRIALLAIIALVDRLDQLIEATQPGP